MGITRREFFKRACALCAGVGISSGAIEFLARSAAFAAKRESLATHEAMYYKSLDEVTVQCQLCPRGCTLGEAQRGFCRVREARGGKLYTAVYGAVCSRHVDPIEKKPLFHFLPGSSSYSIATAGCNFRCKYCQNWEISQFPPEEVENYPLSPEEVVAEAIRSNSQSIAYTYTDPSIFYEYMLDISKVAKSRGIRTIYRSNGSLTPAHIEELCLYTDAANIDLKGFTQDFYSEVCAGYLDTVLASIKALRKNGVWVELTNLIVPTLNDDMGTIGQMCAWVKDNVGPDVPLHFSRFWPMYKLAHLYPTPTEVLEKARQIALDAGLNYVYIGNIPGHPAENTYCPACKGAVIRRSGFFVTDNQLKDGRCASCGEVIAGVWK